MFFRQIFKVEVVILNYPEIKKKYRAVTIVVGFVFEIGVVVINGSIDY